MLLVCLMVAHGAEPLKIALPPGPRVEDLEDEGCAAICLSLYLRERLSEIEDVRLVSEGWAEGIFYETKGGKRDIQEGELFRAFSAFLPVDAVIDFHLADDKLVCVLHTAQQIHRREISYPEQANTMDAVHAASVFVAAALKLSPEATRHLSEKRTPNNDVFEACYVSQRVLAAYGCSLAETRLKLLQPHLTSHARCLPLAARVLGCARGLTTSRYQEFTKTGLEMAKVALPPVLGTPMEHAAYGILRESPTAFEDDLIAMVRPLTGDELDLVAADSPPAPGEDDPLALGLDRAGGALAARATMKQRFGALRCLGALNTEKALETLRQCADSSDARVRQAAAFALQRHEGEAARPLQEKLTQDEEPCVAFLASLGLWKRGADRPRLLTLARAVLGEARFRLSAAEVLGTLGTRVDVSRLIELSGDRSPAVRASAAGGLLRLGAADHRRLLSFLREASQEVVLAALSRLPKTLPEGALDRVIELANNPYTPVSQAARLALARFHPQEPRARDRFDLAVEHSYIRMKIVDSLVGRDEAWALDELADACGNSDSHTRAHALTRSLERDPTRARRLLIGALTDPYHWVRLHAAAMLPNVAKGPDAPALRKALAIEKDEAIRLYLADALAKAEGRPLPEPKAAAHTVDGKKALTWVWGSSIEDSPIEAYYHGRHEADVSEEAKRASRAGKVYFGRLNTTVRNSGLIITHPTWQDKFWLTIDRELNPANLPWTDGLVFGEETMSTNPDTLWATGWLLFCRDAGLDSARVNGDRRNLSAYEARAWTHWAATQIVAGFNVLYDYVKLRYAKLRPGLQVCTFLPSVRYTRNWTSRSWKFDVVGAYRYGGSNRNMYTQIRWLKTLWPDRPVLWLSNGNMGIGFYGPIRYDQKVPAGPVDGRSYRAYADSVSAWLAGADPGWFNGWCFVRRDAKTSGGSARGVRIRFRTMSPGRPVFKEAIEYAFEGVEAFYRSPPKGEPPKLPDMDVAKEGPLEGLQPDEGKAKDDGIAERVRREKERLRIGFHLLVRYLFDCARVFSSLPRLDARPEVLTIHPWMRASLPDARGFELLNAYDYLCDVNMMPQLDLSRYRMIAVSGLDEAPLTDHTIEAITNWLRDQPGLLYVHGIPSDSNTNEASTAADHDGRLMRDWPWEKDVRLAAGKYQITDDSVQALASSPEGPTLVLWKKRGFRGAVLFDAGPHKLEELRQAINSLHEKQRVGVGLNGPKALQLWRQGRIAGAVSGGSSGEHSIKGVDLMTGEPNPVVGPARSAAVVARDYRGKYLAAYNGVSILCDKPIAQVEPIASGLRVQCPGLIRAGSGTGAVKVVGGREIPKVEAAKVNEWILFGEAEGIVSIPIGDTGSSATYIRCRGPVTITQRRPSDAR